MRSNAATADSYPAVATDLAARPDRHEHSPATNAVEFLKPPAPPGADLSLALPPPPRVAQLTIPPRIFPGRTTPANFPSVLAVDASGLLLLKADQGPATGSTVIDLPCFSSQTGEWVSKDVPYPLPPRPLSPNGVLALSGRLWWVDLSWCLLTCDPFADAPVLAVVPLPDGKALQYGEAGGLLDKYRCVGVSAGKLRFVDMYRSRNSAGAAQISVWTLADPDSTEWTLEYEATFAEICDDASFKAAGLPRKIPVLALIHPTNPDVLYFFLDERMVGVDVRARKVVDCEVYELVEPPREHVSSRFVHAWQLPPALCSGSAKETEDDGVNDELQQLLL